MSLSANATSRLAVVVQAYMDVLGARHKNKTCDAYAHINTPDNVQNIKIKNKSKKQTSYLKYRVSPPPIVINKS